MPPKRASRAKASKDVDIQDVVVDVPTPSVAVESVSEESNNIQNDSTSELKAILQSSVMRTRELFAEDQENIYTAPSEEQAR
jgi:pleiotropic regulator 1